MKFFTDQYLEEAIRHRLLFAFIHTLYAIRNRCIKILRHLVQKFGHRTRWTNRYVHCDVFIGFVSNLKRLSRFYADAGLGRDWKCAAADINTTLSRDDKQDNVAARIFQNGRLTSCYNSLILGKILRTIDLADHRVDLRISNRRHRRLGHPDDIAAIVKLRLECAALARLVVDQYCPGTIGLIGFRIGIGKHVVGSVTKGLPFGMFASTEKLFLRLLRNPLERTKLRDFM